MRVAGVKGVANELEVKPLSAGQRTYTDIAQAAVQALEWHYSVPHDRVKVKVIKTGLPFMEASSGNTRGRLRKLPRDISSE